MFVFVFYPFTFHFFVPGLGILIHAAKLLLFLHIYVHILKKNV